MMLNKEHVFSAVDAANDHVNHVEDKYIVDLLQWEADAEHRAEACGCRQCRHEPRRAGQMIGKELQRLSPTDQDDYEP